VKHRKITRRGGVDLAAEAEARKESPMTDAEYREWQRSRATLEQRERDRQIEAQILKIAEQNEVDADALRASEPEPTQTYAERLAISNARVKAGQRHTKFTGD
jgi:hypothetical protein